MRVSKAFFQKVFAEMALALFVFTSLKRVLSYNGPATFFRKVLLSKEQPGVKEIIFYIHGWQRDKASFETTSSQEFVPQLAQQGYLFKDLTWHEQAHSSEVREVQHRIWRNHDGFCDKLLSEISQTLSEHPGVPFRFVGHSLGNQVMLRLSESLIQKSPKYWPQRLALLEPAFVRKFHRDDAHSRQSCLELLKQCHSKNIAIEVYRSSFITRTNLIGYSNHEIISNTPFPSVDLNFHIEDWFDFAKTHTFVKSFYFNSFFSKPLTTRGGSMPYAASSTAELFHHYGAHFEQTLTGEHAGKFLKVTKNALPPKCPFMSFLGFSRNNRSEKKQELSPTLK